MFVQGQARFFLSQSVLSYLITVGVGVILAPNQNDTHTLGSTPLDEGSARRRNLYRTTYNTHTRHTSMPPAGFEPAIPASKRPQTTRLLRWYKMTNCSNGPLKDRGFVRTSSALCEQVGLYLRSLAQNYIAFCSFTQY
jgi:hypothetical protein